MARHRKAIDLSIEAGARSAVRQAGLAAKRCRYGLRANLPQSDQVLVNTILDNQYHALS